MLRRCIVLCDPQYFVVRLGRDRRLEGGVFEVLVAVTLGFAFQPVALKLCFRDKPQSASKSFQTCGVVQIFLNLFSRVCLHSSS